MSPALHYGYQLRVWIHYHSAPSSHNLLQQKLAWRKSQPSFCSPSLLSCNCYCPVMCLLLGHLPYPHQSKGGGFTWRRPTIQLILSPIDNKGHSIKEFQTRFLEREDQVKKQEGVMGSSSGRHTLLADTAVLRIGDKNKLSTWAVRKPVFLGQE